jgi:hypothetical protein
MYFESKASPSRGLFLAAFEAKGIEHLPRDLPTRRITLAGLFIV